MNEERKRILTMVASGKITAEEGDELLDAISKNNGDSSPAAGNTATVVKRNIKYLRVTVDSTKGDNVNVKIPVALLRAGIKLKSLIPPQAFEHLNGKMAEHGFNLDLNSLKSEDIESLIESMSEMNVDVNSAQGDKVKVYFE